MKKKVTRTRGFVHANNVDQATLSGVLLQDGSKPRCRAYVDVVAEDGKLCVRLDDGVEIAAFGYCEMDGLWAMTWDPETGYIKSHTKLGHV